MKDRKKEITLLVIAILVIVSMIAGATYAFFKAQIGPAANFDINATTSTTDNLTFSTEGDIVLNVTAESLGREKGDYSDTAIARARLIKSNTSESATAHYNIYLLIEENEMEYSSYTKEGQPNLIFMNKEKKEETDLTGYTGVPELILSVKKGGKEQPISKRLTPTDGGYDITEAEGLYAIGENIEIISDGDVTDEWKVTVTFKNLEYNQQLNTGRSLKGKIIITAEKLLYEINDAAGLRQLSTEVNNGDTKEGKYYVLTNNIDLGDHEEGLSNFTPIGTETNSFQGNFNGDKYTISNLYINNNNNIHLGLFGYGKNINLSNLTISGKIINTVLDINVGGFIGNVTGNSNFNNLTNYIDILYNGSGDLSTNNSLNNYGGIIGLSNISNIKINNCKNYASITAPISAGGLIGRSDSDNLVAENCYNSGNINSTSTSAGILSGSSMSDVIINKSYNTGYLYSSGLYASGILGTAWSSVVSRHNIYILNSYNLGNVEASTSAHGLLLSQHDNVYILNSFNNGKIISPNNSGKGLINAFSDETVRMNNNYNSSDEKNFAIGRFSKPELCIVENTYYLKSDDIRGSNANFGTSIAQDTMQNQEFVDILNQNAKSINLEEIDESLKDYTLSKWKLGENGYPTLINE